MVPVQLKLYNFTSYGTDVPTLDFTGFKLACLSGYNGAGKSSILDSITWCLWGSSRAGDNADKLIRVGKKEMAVEFTFELESNLYRVVRRRLLKGTGSTSLELFVRKIVGAELASAQKGQPRLKGEAQGLPLQDNWLNLTEGTIRATQEKIIQTLHMTYEVFVNSSYLRQGNADEFTLKGATDRKRILADILGLSHYDLLEERAKEKVKDIFNKVSSIDYQITEIESELSQKDIRALELTQAETKLKELEVQRTTLEIEIKSLREQKEALMMKNQLRQKMIEALEKSAAERDEIAHQGAAHKKKIIEIEEKLSRTDEVEKNIIELGKLEEENKELFIKQSELLDLTTKKSTLSAKVATVRKQVENLNLEIRKNEEEIQKVKAAVSRCPMCGSELDVSHKKMVLEKLEKEVQEKQAKLKEIDANQEAKQVVEIENKINHLNYDQSHHSQIRQRILSLEPAKALKNELSLLTGQLEAEKKAREELVAIYMKKDAQIKVDREALEKEDLRDVTKDLDQVQGELKIKESINESLKPQENEARAILGKAKQLVERSTQLETLREQKIREKAKLSEEKGNYEELALAFGKKGIQAMIIETVIPEIEEETNNLLDKLTEGRMKVTLETQREAKSGGTIETLDIILSDEMGSRSYEMYSGGEAFRANFAIRLALSKLLTHRAGAKLQFLVVDEGFGTQDAQGRDRLVEAINLIKDDFEKILVVTHIEELKEAFPCRIEVMKNNNGSTFEVVN